MEESFANHSVNEEITVSLSLLLEAMVYAFSMELELLFEESQELIAIENATAANKK